MKRITFNLLLAVALFCTLSAKSQKILKGIDAEMSVAGSEQVIINEKTNSLSFVVMKTGSFVEEAKHLNWLSSTVLKQNSDYQFVLYKKERDNLGFTHYRYKQYYKGIKVEHGVYYVHVKDGKVNSVNGEFYPNISQYLSSVSAQINVNSALNKAKSLFNASEVTNHSAPTDLIILSQNNSAFLCYHFDLSTSNPLKHSEVYVDAQTNKIVLEINKIHTTDVSGTLGTQYNGTKSVTIDQTGSSQYRLQQSTKNIYTKNCNNGSSMGSAVDFTNSSSTWSATTPANKAVFDLYYGLEKSYDYYSSKFSRTSYDGMGTQVKGIAHYSSGFNNAFWDGTYMVFGDGDGFSYNPFSCTDIVGHELTHAVTESSAGLVYMNESGGLNESFSDIFGVAIDFYANPSTANFLEGEQCSVTNTPLRNMINPKATLQPNTYMGQYWIPSGGSDNGGVHTNSQVQNHWFYLLCQGGTGTNDNSVTYNISAIGISDAEKIAYRNLTNYLTPNSTYADARTYAIQSAIDLFGSCSNNVTQCANAWYAVGVGSGLYSNAVVSQFSSNNNYSCSVPAPISFSNNSLNSSSYTWHFGDGGTSTSANPTHTYTTTGNYSVKLISAGTSSCNTTDSITKANFVTITNVGMPVSACTPSQGSNSSSYGITKVEFGSISKTSLDASEGYKNFACTNQATLIAGNPYVVKITTPGFYEKVSVWIDYNNDGVMNQTNELILNSVNALGNINTHTLVVQTPTNAVLNTPLRLRVTDDYTTISGACATHYYGQTEDYTVRFNASTVKPSANFFCSTKLTTANSTVNFYDSTLNVATNYRWEFQGGSPATSVAKNPSVLYPSIGTYSVKLVATNAFGADSTSKTAYINVVSVFNLCAGTNSTSSASGTLYDTGGPSGYYLNNENCQFLVNPGCTGTITATFSQFSLESCCDYLRVYNGTTTAAPLLGSFNGSTMPPTLNASSGKMLFVWTTDGSATYPGFAASWTSVLSGTVPPVANFSVSSTTPPLNTSVQFSDQTTNLPFLWNWEFGDGTTSSIQNPTKIYTSSGLKTVTLTATNCSTTSVVTKTLIVQSAPNLTVNPSSLSGATNCGDSLTIPVTLTNNGTGSLVYNSSINGSSDSVKVLICTYGVDMTTGGDYTKTLNAISSYYSKYSVSQYSGNTSAGLQSASNNKDVILFPRQSSNTDTHYSTYATALNSFVTNGGTVIFCGSNGSIGTTRPFTTGLFNGTYNSTLTNYSASILLPNDSLVYGIGTTTFNGNYNYLTITDASKIMPITITSYTYDVVTYKNIGAGRAIFIGSDFYTFNTQFSYVLARAIKTSKVLSNNASYLAPSTGTLSAAQTQTANVILKTGGKPAGVYSATLSITGNNPSPNPYLVPITYTINGAATSSVSATCINFGTMMQFTTKRDSVVLYNLGCSPMSVSSMSITNAAYSYTPSTSFTIAPWSNRKIYVKLNPSTSGNFNDTLRITNNGGNIKVCLNASVTSAPIITVTPVALTMSTACGNSATTTLTIENTGGSNLTYTATGSNSSANVKVLVITNLVYPNYYTNMLTALNNYSVNYTVTQHTLTNAAALQTALQGKDILIIPQPYNGTQYVLGSFQTYSATVNNFVSNGGTALSSGFYNINMMNDLGLFNSTAYGYASSGNLLNVVDTNDVIMRGLPFGNISAFNYSYYHTVTNAGVANYIKSGTSSVVCKRNIGSGRAIFVGYEYQASNNTYFNKILANSVKSSVSAAPWLSGSSSSNTVIAGGTSTITYTFNSTGLSAGTYSSVISINSNDPLTPTYTVPVSFSVYGSATSSVSANCKYFGTLTQYTSKTDSLILYNSGCATMSVTSLNTSNSVYTYTPSSSFTIAPFSNKKIYVKFSPTTVGVINDTLRITNNGGNQNICLSGTVTSAPSISVSPNNYSVNVSACNSIATGSVNIANIGGSNLTYSVSGSATTTSVNVLAITNYVDMTGEYINTINSITTYFSGSNITQHSLTSVSALQTALTGKKVILIPEQESYLSGFLQTYSTTINNFVSAGGTAIICGTDNYAPHYDLGFFSTSTVSSLSSATVIDTNDVIMRGLPMGAITAPNATYGTLLTDPTIVNFVKSGSYSVVCKKQIGSGKAIFIASDFYTVDNNFSKIIANSVKYSTSNLPGWLSVSTTSQTVTPGNSSTLTFTLNSGNLPSGTYTTALTINSNDPLTPTYTVPITMVVGNNPCANFALTNSNNCTGIVTFTNSTINTATSYSWNFGNGTTSALTNPTVTYSVAGTYSVVLTACNGTMCSSYTRTLTINGVGGPLTNSCTPTSYLYGSNYGILNVTLNTINKSSNYAYNEGYQDNSCGNQTTLTLGSTYTLNVTTSSFYYENVNAWIDFDNNGVFATSEQVLTSYNKLMTHTVSFTPPGTAVLNTPLRMRIIDESSSYAINSPCYNSYYGQAEDYTIKIQPNNVPPQAAYSTQVNSCQGTVNFTDNSLNNPTSWIWNFGDGNASSLQNPSHTYTSAGTFTVLLIASNSFGSNYTSQTITVNPLIFNIGVGGTMAINQPLTYTTSLNGGLSYTWDFGDGSLSGIQTSTHSYTAAGTYTVKLTIISGGCVNTMSTTVLISTNVGIDEAGLERFGLNVFPNPFNTQASIKLKLPEEIELTIDLYNAIGQKIKTIAESKLYEKGEHTFSTESLAKGVYFLKLKHEEKVYIYKLISLE
ncbi:MAG: peptidase thermolysin [Bacteroidota bacterium]|jgi:Zn-dependent metalloprotease|nr:peptidase thermolysin [Bacteroidota bacterium]